jgi:hypothetical protein
MKEITFLVFKKVLTLTNSRSRIKIIKTVSKIYSNKLSNNKFGLMVLNSR